MGRLKIIHTADFHLGVWPVGLPLSKRRFRLKDFEDQLHRIKNYALETGCDFLVIAGDIFHTAKPSSLLLDLFARFVYSLASRGISVIAVAGTHDKPKAEDTPSYLKALSDAGTPLFYFAEEPGCIYLKGRISGRVVKFSMIPYVQASAIDWEESRLKIMGLVKNLIAKEEYRYDYSIAVAHLTVDEAYIKDIPAIVLREISVPVSIFSNLDYVCLGHIHRHQSPSKNAVYPGSIERVNFDEEDDVKGFVVVEEEGGGLGWMFRELPCRPMKSIPKQDYAYISDEVDISELLTSLLEASPGIEDAIVRLKLRIKSSRNIAFSSIEEVMNRFKVFHWILDVERVREEGLKTIRHTRSSSIEDLFREYVSNLLTGTLDSALTEDVVSEGLKLLEADRSED
ncbi:MAG: exonuclease SbcCD subunit D [Candidatus Bathyarchaeia archaeon]